MIGAEERFQFAMTGSKHQLASDDARRKTMATITPQTASATSTDVTPSINWSRAMAPGPDTRVKITEEYAKLVACDAYFWTWPLVNIYNRRLVMAGVKEAVKAGPLVFAPLNRNAMFTDYVDPAERAVACPNQDVVYGLASIALDLSPVVVQVPEFGSRFWVYQIVDLRSDSFVQLGKMYGTTPGFYLLVGPNWQGEVPKGISKVFRCPSNTGFSAPRVFQDDTPEDKKAIQSVLPQVLFYPLSDYDGTMKRKEWSKMPSLPPTSSGDEESKWVFPEKFVDQLPTVLADAPPLPGEEARYAQVFAVVEAAKKN